jgi:hypothetical protein
VQRYVGSDASEDEGGGQSVHIQPNQIIDAESMNRECAGAPDR